MRSARRGWRNDPVSGGGWVYVASRQVDSRRGDDKVAAVAQDTLTLDPFRGAIFVFLSCSFVKIFARWDGPTPFSAQGIVDVCGAHGWGQSLQTTVDHTLMRGLGTA